ncbi:hypothetical protein ACSBLW_10155 [Thioclava sp. FR2]|uniref:hypothetical protein n=1 Tax=Thioclava sp. FR2 TaxID=3445780 RepID=UPI003EBAB476
MICRIATMIFAGLWAVAVFLWAVGTFGWFGQPTDPLSGVFLIPLGLPWTLLADLLPESSWTVMAILAPGVNLFILRWLCRRFGR